MLQKNLFNPIVPARAMEDAEFEKYIKLRNEQEGPTSPRLIARLKKIFMESHARNVGEERLQKIWQVVEGPLKKNAGLANFALDFGGCRSDHFFPWLISVAKSPSEALEMAYGYGRNLEGKFEYAENDPWYMAAARDLPTLAFHRERQLTVANLVTLAKGSQHGETLKVVDLGAGRMDWARMHGFVLEPEIMKIDAFDKDPSINPDELFPMGRDKSGVTYAKRDIAEALHLMRYLEAVDVIIMQGVASYYPVEIFTDVLMRVHDLLWKNGVFFFDLQLDCIYYRWSVATFGWPEMNLMKSAAEAIDFVEGLRKSLWEKGYRFGAEYKLDTYNKSPAAVMVTLTKK